MVGALLLTLLTFLFATAVEYKEGERKEREFKQKLEEFEAVYKRLKKKAQPARKLIKILDRRSFRLPDGRVFKLVVLDLSALGEHKQVQEFQPQDKVWLCGVGNRLNVYAGGDADKVLIFLVNSKVDFGARQIKPPDKVYRLSLKLDAVSPPQPFRIEVQGEKLKLPVEVFSVWGYSVYGKEKLTGKPCEGREIPLKGYLLGVDINVFREFKVSLELERLPD